QGCRRQNPRTPVDGLRLPPPGAFPPLATTGLSAPPSSSAPHRSPAGSRSDARGRDAAGRQTPGVGRHCDAPSRGVRGFSRSAACGRIRRGPPAGSQATSRRLPARFAAVVSSDLPPTRDAVFFAAGFFVFVAGLDLEF